MIHDIQWSFDPEEVGRLVVAEDVAMWPVVESFDGDHQDDAVTDDVPRVAVDAVTLVRQPIRVAPRLEPGDVAQETDLPVGLRR